MTCSSLLYVQPKVCDINCQRNHELKAGYPFVMAQGQGRLRTSSPLGVEFDDDDYTEGARPVGYLLNILFYSILLSVIWVVFKSFRYRKDRS